MSGAMPIAKQLEEKDGHAIGVTLPERQSPLNLSRRIPELDGLRGLAIAMVVYIHYVWFAIGDGSPTPLVYLRAATRPLWSAVDLFFVLSGFLIGGNLLDARDSPNYFKTFYVRRFCRVLPIYYLFLIAVGIGYVFVYKPIGPTLDWIFAGSLPWYSYLSFGQNFWMAKSNTTGSPILSITWAFAVEVQFYMVVPALIRYLRRSALPYVFVAGIVAAPLVRLLVVFRYRANLWGTYFLLPCRMDSLFLGLLCAYCVRDAQVWGWLVKRRRALWVVFFVLLAGLPALNSKGLPFTLLWITVGYGWTCLLFTTALILALMDSGSLLSRGLRVRWLTGLGTISYGVYLFHLGIYFFCLWLLTPNEWLLANWKHLGVILVALSVTIAIGQLSWTYFEKPIVRWSHSWKY